MVGLGTVFGEDRGKTDRNLCELIRLEWKECPRRGLREISRFLSIVNLHKARIDVERWWV